MSTGLTVLALAVGARAQPPAPAPPTEPPSSDHAAAARVAEASALYEDGQRAHQAGRFVDAAKAFAAADALVPDEAALEAALVAVLKTDEAVLGMELAGRTSRAPTHVKLEQLASRARARFGDDVGRIVVHCARCQVAIDGVPRPRGVAAWVKVGPHQVLIRDGEARETRRVIVEPGAVVTLLPLAGQPKPDPKPPPAPAPGPRRKAKPPAEPGPSPAWFWISFAATGAVGVGAIVSAVDTATRHAEFTDAPTAELAADGEAAQTRTNVLLGVTGGLAALTLAVGLFVVDWDQDDDVSLQPEGLTIRF